jgi:hypothetical protein
MLLNTKYPSPFCVLLRMVYCTLVPLCFQRPCHDGEGPVQSWIPRRVRRVQKGWCRASLQRMRTLLVSPMHYVEVAGCFWPRAWLQILLPRHDCPRGPKEGCPTGIESKEGSPPGTHTHNTHTHTHTHTYTHTHIHTHTHAHKHSHTQRDSQTEIQRDKETKSLRD